MDHQIEQVVGVGGGPSDRAGCSPETLPGEIDEDIGGGEWTIR